MPDAVIPDEAIEAAAREIAAANNDSCFNDDLAISDPEMWAEDQEDRDYYRRQAKAALTAGAPAIVAANQPTPNEDLRLAVSKALSMVGDLPDWYAIPALGRSTAPLVDKVTAAVEAFVAARTATARADGARAALQEALDAPPMTQDDKGRRRSAVAVSFAWRDRLLDQLNAIPLEEADRG